jgi:hypothetical protein
MMLGAIVWNPAGIGLTLMKLSFRNAIVVAAIPEDTLG